MIKKLSALFLILVLFQPIIFAQFKIDQLSSDFDQLKDSLFLGITKTRSLQSLNDNWKVLYTDEAGSISEVSFPIKFTSTNTIIFEKEFSIASDKLLKNFIKLNFLGLNYSAEIFLNNATIYKHAGGEIPFSIDLTENMLNYDIPNTLRIKIQYDINSENTIPLLQRFLFPINFGGVFRDVYLSFKPKIGIKDASYKLESENKPYAGKLTFEVQLENFSKLIPDSLLENYDGRFKIQSSVRLSNDTNSIYFNIWNINPVGKDDYTMDFYFKIKDIANWSPKSPISYIATFKLTNGDNFVYDEFVKEFTILNFAKKNNSLKLNDDDFIIKGVTYIRSNIESVSNYKKIEKDLLTIKAAGFNTVRFSKVMPHPYAVYLCDKLGMFSLIELPLNSVPEVFTSNENFKDRASSFLTRTINYFDKYQTVVGYGAGGSYLRNSENHVQFLSYMNKVIKKNAPNKLTYSSFIEVSKGEKIPGLDLYGFEIYAEEPPLFINKFTNSTLNDSSIYFISEATYPNYKGATNGYLNDYSFEGQAKFFDGIMDVTNESNLKGFVLNTMFDFYGDYTPFFAGFNTENNYAIGILSQDDEGSRLSYNLVKSRLTSGVKTSVPIGSSEEDAPLFFIIAALLISIIIALLINSKRKFREDSTRALLRPYNFYSDLRDQRILASFHSTILMLLLAGSNALMFTILLYYLKNNILFEKIILAFGSYKFSSIVGHFAWNPQQAFIYLYVVTIGLFLLISIIFHMASFFVKTKVHYSSVYSVAIWAFLPLALLVPFETILYKILNLQSYNNIIYLIIILFMLWNFQRFLKGIFVIFDVRPFYVYFFSITIFAAITTVVLFYFQFSANAFDYISLAIKQFSLL